MSFFNYNWFFVRFIGIYFFYSLFFDLELLFLLLNFILLHILNGLFYILFDYIHKKTLSFFLVTLFKIFLIENLIQVSKFFF
uniref:succinate dehydrogenase subunit 4 n=1 Tax=Dasysiphonia japonica TaxID=2506492 RepID=UPI002E7A9A78|nr:succinate dehydrogenase subunit 4 [Dasysiphonia japonica]WQF69518.1 succinate dehydrogenase subunit 4 [Dasysiphonia japonica]